MEISHAFLQPLFNDVNTADIILRVDNIHFHSHVCVLYATSGFWNKYFKYQRAKQSNFGYVMQDQDHGILLHDYSCSKRNLITKLNEYKGDPECEMKYTWSDFGKFLAYLYGHPMKEKKKENLYVLAYLASKNKFDVPELLQICDELLHEMASFTKHWDKQHWKVTLRISKWLGLNKLRCQVLKHVYSKGDSMFTSHVLKELDESDLKIALAISDGNDPCLLDFEIMVNNDDKSEFIPQDSKEFDEIMTEKDVSGIEEQEDILIDDNMHYMITDNSANEMMDDQKGMCVDEDPIIDKKQRKHNYHVRWGENVTLLV
ncbi:15612_t:CDS:2 [Cetraspora pellucida]|uniref:15612_t:CDS:1 n=1 Tax=Cetraspora pellucida TaxID=1433469 RepID=A0ACA9K872_9GLOM|nr:15612_t:CDS:2 [Cetraspora pellucida]